MIGLIAHSGKAAAEAVVRDMVSALEETGIPFLAEKNTAPLAGLASDLDENDLAARCELLVILGGDGTILRVSHRLRDARPPILGSILVRWDS